MTLEDLGNIGDFVGGIAVVVTLVYLAVQIRQNTRQTQSAVRASRTTSYHESAHQGWEAILQFANHPELLQIWRKGADDIAALSADEYTRLLAVLNPMFSSLEIQLHLYESGQIHSDLWDLAFLNSAAFLSRPGTLELVKRRRGPLAKRLYELLEKEAAAQQSDEADVD